MNLLIIDDSKSQAEGLMNLLQLHFLEKEMFIDIDTASESEEIAKIKPDGYDMIICDYRLYDDEYGYEENGADLDYKNGFVLSESFVENGYEGHIVILSGDEDFIDSKNKGGFLGFGKNKDPQFSFILKGHPETTKLIDDCVEALH